MGWNFQEAEKKPTHPPLSPPPNPTLNLRAACLANVF